MGIDLKQYTSLLIDSVTYTDLGDVCLEEGTLGFPYSIGRFRGWTLINHSERYWKNTFNHAASKQAKASKGEILLHLWGSEDFDSCGRNGRSTPNQLH